MNIGLDYSNPDSIIKRIETSNDCPICLESIECPLVTKCCHNVFCLHCYLISNLGKPNSCPCCRKIIDIKSQYVLKDRIPSHIDANYDLQTIYDHSQDFTIRDNFKLILKYIVSTSLNPKIMIIVDNYTLYSSVVNSMLISEEICSILYIQYKYDFHIDYLNLLDEFNKTLLYDCIVMDKQSYINFIETGYTLMRLDYIINYNSDLILDAHSLPKIIKRNKIKDSVTTCIDLQSM
jgi:hypothetical protein